MSDNTKSCVPELKSCLTLINMSDTTKSCLDTTKSCLILLNHV